MQTFIGILILMITSGFLVLRVIQSRSTAADKADKTKIAADRRSALVTNNIQKPWGW